MKFSKNQMECLSHAVSEDVGILCGGATRSGKSFSSLNSFAIWSLNEGIGFDHAVCGVSIESVMRNVGFDLIKAYNNLGAKADFTRSIGTRIYVKTREGFMNVWIIGATDDRGARRIQGSTLKGLMFDEVVSLPEDFFNMAYSRLSVEGAKFWATFNPDHPRHWFKQKVVDRKEAFEAKILHFKMQDNPSLTEKTIDRYDKSFTGHWHKRFVQGLWAGSSGMVYPIWHEWKGEGIPKRAKRTFCLDWGVSNVFACLALKEWREGKIRRAVIDSEMYYEAREEGERTEQQQLDATIEFMKAQSETGSILGCYVWLDPHTPASFKRLLRSKGLVVRNGKNRIKTSGGVTILDESLSGLIITGSALSKGEILIGDCPKLKEELCSYMWDPKKSDQGKEVPIKKDDHACDALRYYAHSTGMLSFINHLPTTQEIGF